MKQTINVCVYLENSEFRLKGNSLFSTLRTYLLSYYYYSSTILYSILLLLLVHFCGLVCVSVGLWATKWFLRRGNKA